MRQATLKETQRFMRQAYCCLREETVVLTRLPKIKVPLRKGRWRLRQPDGLCETDEILLDYRGEILPTFIHELLHRLHPDWQHRAIYRQERRLVRRMSHQQLTNLLRQIVAESEYRCQKSGG